MPVREMLYEALEYVKQIQAIEKQHTENKDLTAKDRFLSKMTKDDKLLPVISIVFYTKNSKDWNGSKSLYDMLDIEPDMPGFSEIKKLIPDYHLNLVEINDINDVKKFKTSLQHIFALLKLNKDKKALYQYTQDNREALRTMDYLEKQAAYILLGEQKRIEQALIAYTDEEKEEMEVCQAIDELIRDGEERGEERGQALGLLCCIEKLIINLKCDLEQACNLQDITLEEYHSLKRKYLA